MGIDRHQLQNGHLLDPPGDLTLKVSEDGMVATVTGNLEAHQEYLRDALPKVLEEAGVVHGILTSPEVSGPSMAIVARGTPPERGEDGKIVVTAKSYLRKQAFLKDPGKRDPKNLMTILNVSQGELLAKRVPPGQGKPGRNVFGEEVPGIPGEWVALKPGEGVEIIEDRLLSSLDGGFVIDSEGRFSVLDQWEIQGDVDASTGHLEFWGKRLEIKGSVKSGFVVDVTGDLVIGGNVEDEATILAGGNVEINGLIRSANTVVKTAGDLRCRAIEYAQIRVGGDMDVADYVLDADCFVEGDVRVLDGKGLVAGGAVRLGGSMIVKVLGTQAYVPTELVAGYSPWREKHYVCLAKELQKLASKAMQLREGLQKLAKFEKLPPDKEKIRQVCVSGLEAIERSMEAKRQELAELERKIGLREKAKIVITEKAFPSVRLVVNGAELVLRHAVEAVEASFRKGEIVLTTLDPSEALRAAKESGQGKGE